VKLLRYIKRDTYKYILHNYTPFLNFDLIFYSFKKNIFSIDNSNNFAISKKMINVVKKNYS